MTRTNILNLFCQIVFTAAINHFVYSQSFRMPITGKGPVSSTQLQSIQTQPCPQIQFTKAPSPSGNFDTLIINNQTLNAPFTEIDYCAGDLEQMPIVQSQLSGTPAITNAGQIVPVKTGGKYLGFIPAPTANNATCFFKADFGSDFNNEISNYSSSLGSLQNRFTTPQFLVLTKKDSVWFGFASNGDAKLWRIRFGASLDNNSPQISEVTLPANTLASPAGAQIVRSGDTTFLFVLNLNNSTTNNVVRLRFSDSLESNPQITTLNNPPILQNSNGFVQIGFGNTCGKWFGFLLGNSQLYRLDYGNSLSNTPTAASLTTAVNTGLGSPNLFTNLRGITLMQDMGRWYALINTNTGTLFRVRFKNGLDQAPDQVTSLGSFGITGTVGKFHFLRQDSEIFGITINNSGTIYKLKFPNYCPVSKQYRIMTGSGRDSTRFRESGKYYFTLSAQSSAGIASQVLDSVNVTLNSPTGNCNAVNLNHEDIICNEYALQASVNTNQALNSPKWDFCTGDFKLPPVRLGQPVATNLPASGHQVVESNGVFYGFISNGNGLYRFSLGSDPSGTPTQPIQITLPSGGTLFSTLTDFIIFRENGIWFALAVFANGENIVRLNFGTDITNNAPLFSIISLPGLLSNARGITIFEDYGSKYGAITNQNSGSITILSFGSTYLNIPVAHRIDVPGSGNLFKISMVKECQTWHAFISDIVRDSVFQVSFRGGLRKPPSVRKLPVLFARGLRALKDGNEYFLFVSKSQPNRNNLYRFSFGKSLDNNPQIDSLGTFQGTAANSGLTNVSAFQLYQTEKSQYYYFGAGEAGQLYRLAFQNPCAADKPIALTSNVSNQIYRSDGKYYFSFSAWDASGNPVSGFDSVTVQNLVDADFIIPGTRCKGEPITFNDASITGPFTSINKWTWNFGDSLSGPSDSSSQSNPTHTFNQAGTYSVRLRVREQGGCINEIIRNIVVADKPRPNFSAGNGSILCTNDSIQFNDLSTSNGDPITQRSWEIRQNGNLIASSTKTNPRFFFNQTGTYQVKLMVKGESLCDSTLTRNIQVGSQGNLVSFANPNACLGENVTFVPSISGGSTDSVRWFVDAAKFSTNGNFNFTFTSASIFSVRLVAYKGQCANSYSKVINVNAKPLFSMAVQAPLFCQGLPYNFSSSLDANQPVKYLWNFGDGTSDTLKNPVKAFEDSGNYNVRLKVTTLNGCFTEDTLKVRAKRAPKALFSFDKACKDEPVTFTNQSTANGIQGGITSYFWEFGNLLGSTSTEANPPPVNYINEPSGKKIVRLTVRTAEDCPNTFSREIIIGSNINALFGYETGCIGTPFRFYDLTIRGEQEDPIVSWQWSIGGLNYNVKNPVVEFDQPGPYNVKLIVKSGSGCKGEVSGAITVLNAASAYFEITDSPDVSTPPFKVIFSQIPSANPSYDYHWDFGDSSSSDSQNPIHYYQKEGVYTVTMTATRKSTICSTKVQKVVNLIRQPIKDVEVFNITSVKSEENLTIEAEVRNKGNVALDTIDFYLKAGNEFSIKETWKGILLPDTLKPLRYKFNATIQHRNSDSIPYICVEAKLDSSSNELKLNNNQNCKALTKAPSLVTVFPNPATDKATIDLSLWSRDPITIRITNALGKEIYLLEDNRPETGLYSKEVPTAGLAPGIYQVLFQSGPYSDFRKLVIINN